LGMSGGMSGSFISSNVKINHEICLFLIIKV
jgi:hypothetical protein